LMRVSSTPKSKGLLKRSLRAAALHAKLKIKQVLS